MEEFELWMVPVELKGYYICFDHMKKLSKIDFFFFFNNFFLFFIFFMSDRIHNKFMFACNMHL